MLFCRPSDVLSNSGLPNRIVHEKEPADPDLEPKKNRYNRFSTLKDKLSIKVYMLEMSQPIGKRKLSEPHEYNIIINFKSRDIKKKQPHCTSCFHLYTSLYVNIFWQWVEVSNWDAGSIQTFNLELYATYKRKLTKTCMNSYKSVYSTVQVFYLSRTKQRKIENFVAKHYTIPLSRIKSKIL